MNPWAKENYFSNGTKKAAKEIIDFVEPIRARHKILPVFDKMAFLVIDFQRGYLDQSSKSLVPAAKEIVPNIKLLRNEFPNNPFIYTRHLNDIENAGNQKKWWRELMTRENPGSELFLEIKGNAQILEKTQYDAFYKTELENILRKEGITQVVIMGTMTNLCCESTARSAFDRGFEVFYVIDAMATRNIALHVASISSAAHGFAYPILAEELVSYKKEK